jgi:hypothetical protein
MRLLLHYGWVYANNALKWRREHLLEVASQT